MHSHFLGLSLPRTGCPVFDEGLRGAQGAADALGIELAVVGADWSASKQAKDIDSFVAKRVDGIVVWPVPVHMGSIVPNIEAAVSAGIPVAVANTPLDTNKGLVLVMEGGVDSGRRVASS